MGRGGHLDQPKTVLKLAGFEGCYIKLWGFRLSRLSRLNPLLNYPGDEFEKKVI